MSKNKKPKNNSEFIETINFENEIVNEFTPRINSFINQVSKKIMNTNNEVIMSEKSKPTKKLIKYSLSKEESRIMDNYKESTGKSLTSFIREKIKECNVDGDMSRFPNVHQYGDIDMWFGSFEENGKTYRTKNADSEFEANFLLGELRKKVWRTNYDEICARIRNC